MLTKTTITALQGLMYLAMREDETPKPMSPRVLAHKLDASPSYMAKITGTLVKAGVLRAHKGMGGGVELRLPPEAVSLLDVVEACQGRILADYCTGTSQTVCAFHRAMHDLHTATKRVLERWTLADLIAAPNSDSNVHDGEPCRMICVTPLQQITEMRDIS
jgi:Rrf2 family protein